MRLAPIPVVDLSFLSSSSLIPFHCYFYHLSPLPPFPTLILHSPHSPLSFSTPPIPHSHSPLPPFPTLIPHSPLSFSTPLIPHSHSPLPPFPTLILHSPHSPLPSQSCQNSLHTTLISQSSPSSLHSEPIRSLRQAFPFHSFQVSSSL